MAEIIPFKAWRYNTELSKKISTFVCPPFDVVSEEQKLSLYNQALNSIHISVPQGDYPEKHAANILSTWKKDGIITQDTNPGIYVYYQHFSFPGDTKTFVRKGFICFIRAYFWDEKVILRHENTMPYSVNDRLDLLAATQLNTSPTHGLYTDENFTLERLMDESMQQPIYDIQDYQGVRDVLSIIDNPEIIQQFIATLQNKQIILADGHHRYESSLLYRQQQMQINPHHQGNDLYNYHMMYLSNTEGDDLRILPTHRLISKIGHVTDHEILEKSSIYFHIEACVHPNDIPDIIKGRRWTFGLLLSNECYVLTLKPAIHASLEWDIPELVKNTDLAVLHYFFIEKVLGIKGDDQPQHRGILYERSFDKCMQQVRSKDANLALIVNGVSIEQVKELCYNGYLMPQKSTFFFPKAICGFVFGSIKDDEK